MKIISIYNNKGGVGKTTTTKYLAKYLEKQSKNILLVDLDPQANLTSQFKPKELSQHSIVDLLTESYSIEECTSSYSEYIDIVTSSLHLQTVHNRLLLESAMKNPVTRLQKKIELLHDDKYDYILFDCPPTMDLLVSNALAVSDEIIIPIKADLYSLDGIELLLNNINDIKNEYNNDLTIASIFMNQYKITNIHNNVFESCTKCLTNFNINKIGDYSIISKDTVEYTKFEDHKVNQQFEELFNSILEGDPRD